MISKDLPLRTGEAQRILANLVQVYTCHGYRGDPRNLQLAMLTGYFDESGLAPTDKFCTVSGFVGNEPQWNGFIGEWIPSLGHHRKNLHMTRLRWNRRYNKIVSDLARLGSIPHHFNLSPVRIGLWHQDYEEIMKGKVDETYANPYIICALISIGTVLEEVIGPNDEIMFIFDRQEGKRAATMDVLHKIVFQIAKMDKRVKDIDFRPHETTVCLDPADYYAYGFRENQIDPTSPRAKACLPIADSPKAYGGVLQREQLEDIVRHYTEHGMVPGSKQRKMSQNLIAALLKAGWSQSHVEGLKAYIDEHNKRGDWL